MKGTVHSMRWFGKNDQVSLSHIRQAGCEGVVSALHQFKPGEIWPVSEIKAHFDLIKSFGLTWNVVESLPVHDHIKLGYSDRDELIENYITSMRNLSEVGVEIITYNFMPLLDWLRTDTAHSRSDGSEILYFNVKDYKIFDLFILERPSAHLEYSRQEILELKDYFKSLPNDYIEKLKSNILLALPGTSENFSLIDLKNKVNEYGQVTSEQMKANLIYFLSKICPVADTLSIKLAIHPDDPPYSVFGLKRIVSTHQDVRELFEKIPNKSNGLCFCTGSFGARRDNDLVQMIQEFAERINFLHLRNTKIEESGNFFEANHLEGDADMYNILTLVLAYIQKSGFRIQMRPDHGPKMIDDLNKHCYPGYSLIGRLKGLAELRGLEYAILREMSNNKS